MKLNPLPQPLPKECLKSAKIFKSFVDGGNNGLDGVIPRTVLENAKGFAIFTVYKAGFVFSARAGSGIVIAKLEDGTWSAPSAIGTAGLGFGGQAGAEVTDFLVVLNSRSRSFMSAGSLTLGGNMSIALGPLGRNGEAIGSLSSSGKVAAMYSYSKTKGLFGGLSVEGSVIVERQDANATAYRSNVTVKQLLSGNITPPEWASPLIKTLESCTGLPGNRKWVSDNGYSGFDDGQYAFGAGMASPRNDDGPGASYLKKKKPAKQDFPPPTWGAATDSGSYFTDSTESSTRGMDGEAVKKTWGTQFESDFTPQSRHRPAFSTSDLPSPRSPYSSSPAGSALRENAHLRSMSTSYNTRVASPSPSYHTSFGPTNGYRGDDDELEYATEPPAAGVPSHFIAAKPGLSAPLAPHEGVARAIAVYDFRAVEPGDLSFKKGDVITVTTKSDSVDDWWRGTVDGREGIFPANFVELA
ncbi:hypothetical protein PLICRDRAFT_43970 [Plicaturopsis crispa FD-325 SS-3]|nr:hypothetical protein PLICRDRAFT_43970 [Plicaturopsis crispa FD-325 SS-3]